ncbi:MAG: sugar phosphate isomerase/epimerase [Candidatus Omnitrophota bacterium]|nr:sugar phosphate isomerase/epimerase [Candidatus Omnitrophota bacterium]
MKETQIAAQLYTLRDYLQTPKDIAKTLAKVRKIGYRIVQLSGLGKIETKELKKILDGEGLVGNSTHTSLERLMNETDLVIEEHKILGAEYAVCPWIPDEYHNLAGYRRLARELSKTGKILAKHKITLCYHNHAFEFEKYDKKTGLEILYSESDPRYLKAELDTYWIAYGGGDPATWCLKYSGRFPIAHLKDLGIKDNKQLYLEVGEGNLDWKSIIAACKKAGVKLYAVEQDICQRDPLESLKISLNNLHGFGLK